MASLANDPDGRRILFKSPFDNSRKSIRLGDVPKKDAERFLAKFERLLSAKRLGNSPDDETCEWIKGLPPDMAAKLAKAGLIQSRESDTKQAGKSISKFSEALIAGRADLKPGTVTQYWQCVDKLVEFFGAEKLIETITPLDADLYRSWLKSVKNLQENTVRGHVKTAKAIFQFAVRGKLLRENPFQGQKTTITSNRDRMEFVDRDTIQRVLDACPSTRWRAIVVLCRYAGLRCPSEVLTLRWNDVDWERGRMTIRSSKTEHHEGGGIRQVPLFPEVRRELEALLIEPDGAEMVINLPQGGNRLTNLRTTFYKILMRAKVEPWGKPFQNLRSSRETELAQEHPMHVVTAWLGNTPKIAMEHYLQVRDSDFEKAAQIPAQRPSETPRNSSQAVTPGNEETPVFQGFAMNRESLLFAQLPGEDSNLN